MYAVFAKKWSLNICNILFISILVNVNIKLIL